MNVIKPGVKNGTLILYEILEQRKSDYSYFIFGILQKYMHYFV